MIIAINFFIIAIILFGSNYLLLLEEMAAAARSMRADARISHWDSTVKCQAWQAVFPVLPECANPALKAHEWPVHMLLLRGQGIDSAGGWRLGPAARAQRDAAAVAPGRWRWRWRRWLQRRAAGTSGNSSASLSTADLPACNCWENVLNFHDCY